jgi:antitoxin ParD1/3/4
MARATTLNVSLTPTLRNYVKRKLKSGRYESASEVVRDALRALQDRERTASSFWENVRSKVAHARGDVAEGRMVDGEAAMNEILAELSEDGPVEKHSKSRRGSSR